VVTRRADPVDSVVLEVADEERSDEERPDEVRSDEERADEERPDGECNAEGGSVLDLDEAEAAAMTSANGWRNFARR